MTIINTAHLSPFVRETALAIFQCLAEAEATVHGTSIEEVHFHEVGAVDAIVDIVGAAIALEAIGHHTTLCISIAALKWSCADCSWTLASTGARDVRDTAACERSVETM